jgi:hypothetical protein
MMLPARRPITRSIDYHLAVPIIPEQFADPELRDQWQREKGMVVLRLWSEQHRRTPIDVFISEPFGFAEEYARAQWQTISEGVKAPVIAYPALLKMKLAAGRAKDLLDVENLRKLDPYR